MKRICQMQTFPKPIMEIIHTKVRVLPHHNRFAIHGTPGWKVNTHESALKAYDKLKTHAKRWGGDVTLVHDYFKESEKPSTCFLVVEITGEVAYETERAILWMRGSKESWLRNSVVFQYWWKRNKRGIPTY
ncbi:hypothetical protein IMZ31_18830 (plasmid) [Pontibacillus sp. ALD_SL1]|uniref:hypothetical protein n=1 Tax=Pontibacillus sp. ALD_SL1 TaxID=2777185 RepID=UPI001A9654BE|nr:hypothetical protein [Pontibacillus sp. ALD_SL1]QST02604.1 hypothetical protein IMZ31_18830 [Pontibacillus sp. ALD_SL1]